MKRISFVILCVGALLPLFAVSCQREVAENDSSTEVAVERGDLMLFLGSGEPDTKATPLEEGNDFDDLLVVVAKDDGTVVQHDIVHNVVLDQNGETEVVFYDLRVGSYHVYAYANIYNSYTDDQHYSANTDWQIDGRPIAEVEAKLRDDLDNTMSDHHRELAPLDFSSTYAPGAVTTGMLLTGHKEVQVGAQKNVGEVKLLRAVARFNVMLYNDTAYEVTVKDLSFHDFNPSRSYILSHWDEQGIPQVPAETVFGPMPPYDKEHPVQIHPWGNGSPEYDGHRLVYSTFMYEGASTNTYRMFATIMVDHVDKNGVHKEQTKTLKEEGLHLLTYHELENMPVSTTCEVLMVSPNTKTGAFVGFDNTGTKVYETARHGTEEQYWRDAKRKILADEDLSKLYKLSLKKVADNCFQIYKTIDGVDHQLFTAGDKETVSISEGRIGDTGWPLAIDFDGALVLFKTDYSSWTNNYFTLDNNNAHFTNANTTDPTKGYYMWALYGVDLPGSPLEVIDHDTEKVSRLTYIRRGMEINVKINVYYGEDDYHINFAVENDYWTPGHTMGHTFN